jgi:hypothetical protein
MKSRSRTGTAAADSLLDLGGEWAYSTNQCSKTRDEMVLPRRIKHNQSMSQAQGKKKAGFATCLS